MTAKLPQAALAFGAALAIAAGFRMDYALGIYTIGWLLVFGGLAYVGRVPVSSGTPPAAKP